MKHIKSKRHRVFRSFGVKRTSHIRTHSHPLAHIHPCSTHINLDRCDISVNITDLYKITDVTHAVLLNNRPLPGSRAQARVERRRAGKACVRVSALK
jgi:hypothetical protein